MMKPPSRVHRAGRVLIAAASILVAAACGTASPSAGVPDARTTADSSTPDEATSYRRTITLDGIDDFTADEKFLTTSDAFAARITWDDANLYIGYGGPDLSTTVGEGNTKWLFVYLDTVPSAGEPQSEQYNTQRATFPVDFAAEYYVRYRANGNFTTLERADAGDWMTATPAPSVAQADTFVELAIPLSSIGSPTKLGLVTWMINEKNLVEGTYAGLYADNFTDGYHATLALTAYLEIDLASSRVPNDPAARRP